MTKKTARRRTASMKNRVSAKKIRRPSELLDHDDPIVADNAAVEINFKRPPQDLSEGKLWARSYTTFEDLDVRLGTQTPHSQRLQPVSSLTFTYSKPNNPSKDEELVFTATGSGAILVSVSRDKLKRKFAERHILVPATLKGLRLRNVSGFNELGLPFAFELFDQSNKPKFKNVRFKINAQEERRNSVNVNLAE